MIIDFGTFAGCVLIVIRKRKLFADEEKNMKSDQKRIKHEQDYIAFLERRLRSANFKKKASSEEYAETETKLKKARLVLRVLEK